MSDWEAPPFDWLAMEEDARAKGDVCAQCGSAFGAVYGHATVTCASCGRPWRTVKMEQEARQRAEERST